MPSPLNVIYLHSHDTGRYISPYGYACRTPHMQRFAEQGVLFRQAFTVNPTCSPSRSALITGMYPHCNGMLGLAHRGFKLFDYHKTWLTTFRGLGYNTVITGQQHYGIHLPEVVEQGLGFETRLDRKSNDGKDVTPATIEFLKAWRPGDRPFFLDAGFFETHRTDKTGTDEQWHNRDESPLGDPRYVRPPTPLPDNPTTRADFADYEVCVNRLDAFYGQILDTLDKTGLAENTIVVITTDHGLAFPGMKCNLTDHGLGVLLMMRIPASMGLASGGGGKVIDSMVTHMDVFPTLCDLLGVPTPQWVQGKSMVPLLDGTLDSELPGALHEAIFAQVNYHAAYEPKRCVRTPRYKYIRRFHERATQVLPNCDDSVSKSEWVAAGWPQREGAAEELYDLMFDPNEAANRVNDPGYRDVLSEMRCRLKTWQEANDDPILRGPIPPPAGVKVTPHSSYSPSEKPVSSDVFDPACP